MSVITASATRSAAAHAICFAMAFSGGLGDAGTPPDELRVSAAVTFAQTRSGCGVASSKLEVVGKVPGLHAEGFAAAGGAPQAPRRCGVWVARPVVLSAERLVTP